MQISWPPVLLAQGFEGSERTSRRAVARAKRAYAAGHRRVYRPWIPELGMWLQFDWGQGARIGGRVTLLWCAWLAWSRFRIVIPTHDRTLPTVIACLDETLRRFGGAPTYALTDNERTVTIDRVAGIAVRHPELVAAGRHYGLQIVACQPADPESKGGSESTVPGVDHLAERVAGRPQLGEGLVRGRRFASVGTRSALAILT